MGLPAFQWRRSLSLVTGAQSGSRFVGQSTHVEIRDSMGSRLIVVFRHRWRLWCCGGDGGKPPDN